MQTEVCSQFLVSQREVNGRLGSQMTRGINPMRSQVGESDKVIFAFNHVPLHERGLLMQRGML